MAISKTDLAAVAVRGIAYTQAVLSKPRGGSPGARGGWTHEARASARSDLRVTNKILVHMLT